jgi:hypothetical protein
VVDLDGIRAKIYGRDEHRRYCDSFSACMKCQEWESKLGKEVPALLAEVERLKSDLAAVREAMAGERADNSRLIAAVETISRCESALSADAIQGHLRLSAALKVHSDKDGALSDLRQILARRAAESKAAEE